LQKTDKIKGFSNLSVRLIPSSILSDGDPGLSFDPASLKLRRAGGSLLLSLPKYQDERGEISNEGTQL